MAKKVKEDDKEDGDKKMYYKCKLICVSTVFCFVNMAFQEQLLRLSPTASNSISLVQHLFISLVGLCRLGPDPFGLLSTSPRPPIPTVHYLPIVFLHLVATLTTNAALNFGISIPLSMIFKSSTLITNMVLGVVLLSKRYSAWKYVSVVVVTAGLIAFTLEDYRIRLELSNNLSASDSFNINSAPDNTQWSQGIAIGCMTASLLFASGIGIYQEYLFGKFGKHTEESLLMVHLLSIPFVALATFSSPADGLYHFNLFTNFLITWSTAHLSPLTLLLFTVLSQYGCSRVVYQLASEVTSLTVTLVVTNRKFLSLMFSVCYFGNAFTWVHLLGSVAVFGGTVAISLV